MTSYFNEEQQDHIKEISVLPLNNKCFCGWYPIGSCPNCDPSKTNADKIKGEGWKAFEAHLRWSNCPYQEGTQEYEVWQVGFEKAFHHYYA